MNLNRNGWEVWEYETFTEVLPQDDSKEHALGDECWCGPCTEIVSGGVPDKLIAHNALDKRD